MNIFQLWSSKGMKETLLSSFTGSTNGGGGKALKSKDFLKKNEKDEKLLSAEEDAEWVKLAQGGDMRAFDQLVSKHRGQIYAMIRNMVKNDADAWDLSQEAFIKAWRALPKFESRARFSTWLFRIAHNVVYDWLRKRHIKSEGELNDEVLDSGRVEPGIPLNQESRPDEAMERGELRKQINAAISQLSPDHKEVILLREVQGMNYNEISEITGSSKGTIMSRLHYARKKLQSLLNLDI